MTRLVSTWSTGLASTSRSMRRGSRSFRSFSIAWNARNWPGCTRRTRDSAAASTCHASGSARENYKYFDRPLPPVVQSLREHLYARLAPTANRWKDRLRRSSDVRTTKSEYPTDLSDFLARCHAAGQKRPTPLLLSYTTGGYNCLHQDIYGDLAFPLQVVFALSRAGADYEGGGFLLVEQRPRAQSRGHALRIEQGAGLVFATRERPAAGAPRRLSGHDATWGEYGDRRVADDARPDLSRRQLTQ